MPRAALIDQLRSHRPVIAPSMLKCDFGNLHREMALLEQAAAKWIHLDVMDGHFVPNLSYGPPVIERLRELTELPFEAHLMISEPGRYLDEYLNAGCQAITFHIEAVPDPTDLLARIREADAIAGLAINPGTPFSAIEPYLSQCDLLLVMSVEPGFGGQAFMPEMLDKVTRAREQAGADLLISIDGGIGPQTIAACAATGCDLYVAGSAIFNQPDYGSAISEMVQLATG